MNGIFAIYKPVGPTSHDVIDQLRHKTGIKKIGHAGTLDPLAKGVLVVAIGREATKKLSGIVKMEKEYMATIRLGEESTTDDAEGVKNKIQVDNPPDIAKLKEVIKKFEGDIKQVPPKYSAIKVGGRKAYQLARRGEPVKLGPRSVFIKSIELLEYHWPELKLRVICGSGVYIRSLARDIGRDLDTGGYIKELERVRVGDYSIQDAKTPESF